MPAAASASLWIGAVTMAATRPALASSMALRMASKAACPAAAETRPVSGRTESEELSSTSKAPAAPLASSMRFSRRKERSAPATASAASITPAIADHHAGRAPAAL